MKTHTLLVVLLTLALSLAACTPAALQTTQTATPTETEIATPVPATASSTPLPTATATLPPAEAPIDNELLFNFPESYQDLLTRPEGCVMAPDPLEDIEVFNQWKTEKLVPILGDLQTREATINFDSSPVFGGINPIYNISIVQFYDAGDSSLITGAQAIFCFRHDDFLYPVVVWTIGNGKNNNYETCGLVLFDGNVVDLNEYGVDIISILSQRKTTIGNVDIFNGSPSEYLPDPINEMINLGMNAYHQWLPFETQDISIGPAIFVLPPEN
jgi:hypothetical protein